MHIKHIHACMYHREELLTRMVQREVPMAISHVEFVCLMVSNILAAFTNVHL